MNQEFQNVPVQNVDASKNWMAVTSFIMGIFNLITCCIPCCGIPLAGVGLGLGIAGLKSEQRTFAIIGIVLNSLGLVMGLGNAAYGVYLNSTGQSPWNELIKQLQQQQQNSPTP